MAGYGKRKEGTSMGIGPFTPHDMTPTDAGNTLKLQEAEWAEIKVEHRVGSDRGEERSSRQRGCAGRASAVEETNGEMEVLPALVFSRRQTSRPCCGC